MIEKDFQKKIKEINWILYFYFFKKNLTFRRTIYLMLGKFSNSKISVQTVKSVEP